MTRGPGPWLLACAAGAGMVLFGAGREWASLTEAGRTAATLTGGEVAAAPSPLALAAGAAALAVLASRGVMRRVVAAVLTLCGLGVAAAVWAGTAGLTPDAFPVRPFGGDLAVVVRWAWPGTTAAGGLLLAAAGIVALVWGGRWRGMAGRYERSGTGGDVTVAAGAPLSGREMWDAIDRGVDPTLEEPERSTDAGVSRRN